MSSVASTPSMSSCSTRRSLQRSVMVPESPATLRKDGLRLSVLPTAGQEKPGLDVTRGGHQLQQRLPFPLYPLSCEVPTPGMSPLRSPLLDRVDTTQKQQPQVWSRLGSWRQQQVMAGDTQRAAQRGRLRAPQELGLGPARTDQLGELHSRLWWAWGPAKRQTPVVSG